MMMQTQAPRFYRLQNLLLYLYTELPVSTEMQKRLNEFLDEEQYTTKSLASDRIKLICQTPTHTQH